MTTKKKRVGILISGRGSNMMSLMAAARDPGFPAEIACVLSNRPEAEGLSKAAGAGLPTRCVDHKRFKERSDFEAELDEALHAFKVDLVACEDDLLGRAGADRLRHRVGDRLQLLQALDLFDQALRWLHFDDRLELGSRVVEAVDPEREAHSSLGAELVDQEWVRRALRVLEEQRRPAGAHSAIDDLGDLEVRIDLGLHADELALALEERDPVAQVGRRRHLRSV